MARVRFTRASTSAPRRRSLTSVALASASTRVSSLSFIPIPDQLLSYLAQKAPPGLLTYYPEDRIMVVNLNDWMPPGVDLSLERTVFERGALTLQLASGSYDLSGVLGAPRRDDDRRSSARSSVPSNPNTVMPSFFASLRKRWSVSCLTGS